MQIVPSGDVIGAAVEGIDLAQPLSEAEFAKIEAAFNEHAVLSFPKQQLDEPQLIAFARRFGAVERIFLTHYAHPKYPEIMFVSNIKENGRDIGHSDAGSVWHTDMSYTARPRGRPSSMRSKFRSKAALHWAIRCFRVPLMRMTVCRGRNRSGSQSCARSIKSPADGCVPAQGRRTRRYVANSRRCLIR
jgi:hypothetical protein